MHIQIFYLNPIKETGGQCHVDLHGTNGEYLMYVTLPGQPSGTEWPGTDVHVWQRCHTGKC